jgi:hypothetical protein
MLGFAAHLFRSHEYLLVVEIILFVSRPDSSESVVIVRLVDV